MDACAMDYCIAVMRFINSRTQSNREMIHTLDESRENMHSQKKYKECVFFFKKLERFDEDDIEWDFYYSAFLAAWRSVLDVLLYDAAFRFNLGFTINDKIREWQFQWAAKKEENVNALSFLSWWSRKRSSLNKLSIWEDRDVFLHRGYAGRDPVFVPLSMSSLVSVWTGVISGTNTYSTHELIYPNIIEKCADAIEEMKKILDEAIELLK